MTDVRAFFVPGRIEVLGKHTDYCGGASLVAAVNRGFEVVTTPCRKATVEIEDVARRESVSFELSERLEPRAGHWSLYPMTVARRFAEDFPDARRGVRMVISSDLPPAAGMSSSSAFVVATWLALEACNDLSMSSLYREKLGERLGLAAYLAGVEAGVGTEGGSEDHTAILCSQQDALARFSYRPPSPAGSVRLPGDLVFAVADSGVAAEKSGAARERYNRCSRRAQAVVDTWNHAFSDNASHLAELLSRSPDAAERAERALTDASHPGFSAEELRDRLEHFREENNEILPAAWEALDAGLLAAFGALVDRSQELAGRLLGNQVPETIRLARSARALGAHAASAFGAGFGGSVWALIDAGQSDDFLRSWSKRYAEDFPERSGSSGFFVTPAAPAAFEIS